MRSHYRFAVCLSGYEGHSLPRTASHDQRIHLYPFSRSGISGMVRLSPFRRITFAACQRHYVQRSVPYPAYDDQIVHADQRDSGETSPLKSAERKIYRRFILYEGVNSACSLHYPLTDGAGSIFTLLLLLAHGVSSVFTLLLLLAHDVSSIFTLLLLLAHGVSPVFTLLLLLAHGVSPVFTLLLQITRVNKANCI